MKFEVVPPSLRQRRLQRSMWRVCMLLMMCLSWLGSKASAQDDASKLKLTVARAIPGGVHVYAPEKWGVLHINVTNASDQPRNVLVVTYFDVEPTLQFGRRLRIPARATLHTNQPVLIPKLDPKGPRQLDYHSLIFDANSKNEVLVKEEQGQLLNSGALLVNHDRQITALFQGVRTSNDEIHKEPYELVLAARLGQYLDRRMGRDSMEGLPFDEFSLEAINNLVITGDRLVGDAAAIAAVRRWMFGGGHVWLMLDRSDPRLLELLLGDEANCHVVDRVELNSVRIDLATDVASAAPAKTVEHEVPVDFVRTSISGCEVRARVNGWPAAFVRSYGHGSLLVTTLGPRGWMIERTQAPPPPSPPSNSSDPATKDVWSKYELLPQGSNVLRDFFLIRQAEFVATDRLAAPTAEFVGYAIPGRGLVLSVLFVFVVAVTAVGVWQWRQNRLERMGWMVPVIGAIAGLCLIGIGHSNRHEIAATVAGMSVVQALPGTDDLITQGLVATYHPEGSREPIGATRGGRLVPDMTGLKGTTRRMLWTDMGHWHWENVPKSAGQSLVPFAVSDVQVLPVDVRATVGANGVQGRILSLPSDLADPVIVTRAGRIGVELNPSGDFVATTANVFSRDQFLDAQLLDDEQTRRRQVMQSLLSNAQRADFPSQPMLMAWTRAAETGFDFGSDYAVKGSAWRVFPIKFERPEPQVEFAIPAPLLPFRVANRPDGRPSSQIFDQRRNEWRESATYSTLWLRFQVPLEFFPLVLKRGELNVRVSGPIGRLELLGLKAGAAQSLQTAMDPVGTVQFKVDAAEALLVDETGGLRLGLNIGDPQRPELTQPKNDDGKPNYWRIDDLRLTVWGEVLRKE